MEPDHTVCPDGAGPHRLPRWSRTAPSAPMEQDRTALGGSYRVLVPRESGRENHPEAPLADAPCPQQQHLSFHERRAGPGIGSEILGPDTTLSNFGSDALEPREAERTLRPPPPPSPPPAKQEAGDHSAPSLGGIKEVTCTCEHQAQHTVGVQITLHTYHIDSPVPDRHGNPSALLIGRREVRFPLMPSRQGQTFWAAATESDPVGTEKRFVGLFGPKAKKESGKSVQAPRAGPPPACWPAVFLSLEQPIPRPVMVPERPPLVTPTVKGGLW
ncbi:not available [Pontoporia blainvillei]|uniref:Not available n=1 Tax=Pontoporia blainvillei TaxID=48723 RepID=A0ABX0S9W9_PONBL|nr:not available [Pontoporia blainvillei]